MADQCPLCSLDAAGNHAATCPIAHPQASALRKTLAAFLYVDRCTLVAQIQALTAEVERLESERASLADALNTELRENYGSAHQVEIGADFRPAVQALIDNAERSLDENNHHGDWSEDKVRALLTGLRESLGSAHE